MRPPSVRARPSPQARARHTDALARWQQTHGATVDGPPHSIDQSVSALHRTLLDANTDAYVNQLNRFARTVGHSQAATRNTLAPAARARLSQQASESAHSIVHTQVERGMALEVVHAGDPLAAGAAYDAWNESQQRLIAQYESGRAADMAMRDVLAYNTQLRGSERLDPQQSAGLSDDCDDALAMGDVPLGTLDSFPAHPRCIHYVTRSFGTVDDPQSLWVGDTEEG